MRYSIEFVPSARRALAKLPLLVRKRIQVAIDDPPETHSHLASRNSKAMTDTVFALAIIASFTKSSTGA